MTKGGEVRAVEMSAVKRAGAGKRCGAVLGRLVEASAEMRSRDQKTRV